MNGYGSHTYSFINAANERFWVKFHFKTLQGHHALDQSTRRRPSSAWTGKARNADLFEAIEQR